MYIYTYNLKTHNNLKNDKIISVHFQGKQFNIMVVQVYAPTSNAEEAEQFYEDLQDLLEHPISHHLGIKSRGHS